MPLASLAGLMWYGPGAGAMVSAGQASAVADIKATARARSTITAAGSMPRAKGTRLINRPATIQGAGSMPRALPKARARALATIRVGALTQDDVTGAVLEAKVEGSLSLKDALRLLLAVNLGKTTISGSTVTFRDVADSKARVTATMSGSTRTDITRDAT